jgi:hypothetical protein
VNTRRGLPVNRVPRQRSGWEQQAAGHRERPLTRRLQELLRATAFVVNPRIMDPHSRKSNISAPPIHDRQNRQSPPPIAAVIGR